MSDFSFITNKEIYEKVILDQVCHAIKFLWIATADIKDLYVKKNKKMVPFLEILSDLVENNVAIRLLHAKEPGPRFREDFDKYENLIDGLERMLCPRVHFKSIIVDGKFAFTGSANLTGAGIGAKGDNKRNFESGITTTNEELINKIMDQFDKVWMGSYCKECGRKDYCAEYDDIINI